MAGSSEKHSDALKGRGRIAPFLDSGSCRAQRDTSEPVSAMEAKTI